ncbi:MAG: hypothetical protein ACP5RM_01010 [Candidatus Micrarchaeia archaeon]
MKSSLIIIFIFALAGLASAGCNYTISGSNQVTTLNSCTNATISFSAGTSNSSFYCSNNVIVSKVVFGNNTFNNTLYNCTFSNATVESLNNAYNNLIGPSGSYKFNFVDNISNVAIGYFFIFVPLNQNKQVGMQGFASVMPYNFEQANPGLAITQDTTQAELINAAKSEKYPIPRFGFYAPGPVTNRVNATFKLETEQVYKNLTINYNPYWFICPFWGWDELTFKTFYIYNNTHFTPTLIYPNMEENIQYPDNTSIFWNYTIIKYDNAPNMTLYLWKGYQVAPFGKVMHVIYNVTNGTISYDRGVQSLGVHETIAVLKSPEVMEHDNSTTETYGVGLSFCTDEQPPITLPGYYSLAYGSLHQLQTFWITNQTCSTPLTIQANNVIINCKNGIINSTETSVTINDGANVTIENCNIYGNAFNIVKSNNVKIINSNLYANKRNETAITAKYSSVLVENVTFHNYLYNYLNISSSILSNSTNSIAAPTQTGQVLMSSSVSASSQYNITALIRSSFGNNSYKGPRVSIIQLLLFFTVLVLCTYAVYLALILAFEKRK